MNKFIVLVIVSAFTLGAVSCKKSSSSDKPKTSDSTTTNPTGATYYIDYKVNGTAVTDTAITATRGASSTPRTMNITGATKTGAAVNFNFYAEESFIGFVPGLTMQCTSVSYPNYYVNYTSSTGISFSTQNDSNGIFFGILAISYTKGGVMSGTFSGSITTATGTVDQITDGTYNVKFSN